MKSLLAALLSTLTTAASAAPAIELDWNKDPVAQVQHSLNELELLRADGSIHTVYRSQVSLRYIYKHEMELLLRVAGFARWEIYGDFDRHPLALENQAMVVTAWNA